MSLEQLFNQPGLIAEAAYLRAELKRLDLLLHDAGFAFLANQFQLAGGDVKNVALDAAFLAADDEGCIEMKHLVRAMARQQVKRGRSPQAAVFKQYYALKG